MDIGEVEGEIEGSEDQNDELGGAKRPRRDERSTHQRGPGKQPWKASPLGRHDKREADNGHDNVKNQKRKKWVLVCYNCGGKGHPARLCPTPSDHAGHAVDEEGRRNRPTKVTCVELRGNANSMVQVTKMMTSWEWDVSPQNKASGSASQLWWTLAQQKTSYLQASDAGIGFRGAGGERIRNHGQRKFKVRMRGGHVTGTTWQVAKMVAAGNRVHLDSKDPRIVRPKGDVIPLRKAGNVFVVDLWVRKDATSRRPGFHRQA